MSTSKRRSPSPKPNERLRQIELASIAGVAGNGALAAAQIVIGLVAGSFAVVGAGIDAATDIVTSLITLFVAAIAEKPPDHTHPYGHGRAETIATKALSFVILVAGFELGYSTVVKLITGRADHIPAPVALPIVVVTLVGKLFLATYKSRVGRRTHSPMLLADARNMLNDVILQLAILIGLLCTFLFHLAIMDSLLALGVSLWIVWVGLSIFWQGNAELMEGLDDPSLYARVFAAVATVPGAHHPHRTRARKLNNLLVIDLDIEVDGRLSVAEGHEIGKRVERRIKAEIDDVYDVIVHIEPLGNVEQEERYGLSRRKLIEGEEQERR